MPRLEPIYQTVEPQGELSAQATPQDFGSQIGAGMQNLGRGVGDMAQAVISVEDAKSQSWAIDQAASARLDWSKTLMDRANDPKFAEKYGVDGAAFTDTFKTDYENFAATAISNAPTPAAKQYLHNHLTGIGEQLMNQAMDTQAKVGAAYVANNLQNASDNDARSVYANPSLYPDVLAARMSAVDNSPHLDPEQRATMKRAELVKMSMAAGQGAVQNTPEQLLQNLKPDELAKFKPTPRIEKVINGNLNVTLPLNAGADLVKPYDAGKIADIATKVQQPSPYDRIFQLAAQTYGVNATELKMRAVAESGLDPQAKGPVTPYGQAGGIMQLTEATAKSLGVTDVHDAQQSIFAAAQLLANLQQKAGGDTAATDKLYYGGENKANWGPNTEQYANNLAAVRTTLGQGDAPHTTFDQVLQSLVTPQEPVRNAAAPIWFNQLPYDKQYDLIETAKQQVKANEVRDAQRIENAAKAKKFASDATLDKWMPRLADDKNPLTPQEVMADPTVDHEGKKWILEAMHSDLMGQSKNDPATFNDLFQRIHADDASPNKIVDDNDLLPYVGKGLSVEGLNQLRTEISGRKTADGKVEADTKAQFLEAAKSQITTTSMTGRDATGDANYYKFTQAFLSAYEQKKKDKVPWQNLLNPQSKDYLGSMVGIYSRTPMQAMKDMADSMKSAPGSALMPPKTTVGDKITRNGVTLQYLGGDPNSPASWKAIK